MIGILVLALVCTFIGIQVHKDSTQDTVDHQIKLKAEMFKMEIYDVLMNISSSHITTNVQNGTFEWTSRDLSIPQISNYTLNYVQIGPLGFNVLLLNPPATPLNILTVPNWRFKLSNFVPIINQLIVIPQGVADGGPDSGPALLRLTSSNAKKMQITGGCLTAGTCLISGTSTTDTFGEQTAINALNVDRNDFEIASSFYLEAYLYGNPDDVPLNKYFTLTSPWEFILPTV